MIIINLKIIIILTTIQKINPYQNINNISIIIIYQHLIIIINN